MQYSSSRSWVGDVWSCRRAKLPDCKRVEQAPNVITYPRATLKFVLSLAYYLLTVRFACLSCFELFCYQAPALSLPLGNSHNSFTASMAQPWLYDSDDPMAMYQAAMAHRGGGGLPRRFDEYYRCYPLSMMPGPDRDHLNYGGKIFLPGSALDKLSRLHVTYPMLFELINGASDRMTHAGVLEFTAEEGKIYLPSWLMQVLQLEAGDLIQVKSTDLPPGNFIKIQPQSPAFLDISDPKAVLEHAFRAFACLTVGDVFQFSYNDEVYDVAVLEVKPDLQSHAICTMETDLSVDFAEPVGYQEMMKAQAAERDKAPSGTPVGGKIASKGTMAQALNYAAGKPSSGAAAQGQATPSSRFVTGGQRLGKKTNSTNSTGTSTPLGDQSSTAFQPPKIESGNGPQPFPLKLGKLFFGYEYKPLKKKDNEAEQTEKSHFAGRGQNMRGKVVDSIATEQGDVEMGGTQDGDAAKPGRSLRDKK